MAITHPKVAVGADDPAAEINKAEWNASHTVADGSLVAAKTSFTGTDKVLGRSTAGAGNGEEITVTAAGRALIDDADAAAQRTTLGLGTLATQSGTFSGTSSGTNTGDQTVPAFATPSVALGTAAAAGAASTVIRSDSTIVAFDATTPAAVGTAAVGAATVASRRDHVHATGAGTPTTQAFGDAAATGSGPAAAMTDHKHAMPALGTGATNAAAGNDSRLSDSRAPTGAAAGSLSGTYPNPGVAQAEAAFALTGVISPAQIVANTNDYAPTGLSTATVLRLSTDAARNITGLTGGAAGRIIVIENVGSFSLTLTHEDALSSAANRFSFPNSEGLTLQANGGCVLQYDATSSRWRAIGRGAVTVAGPDANVTVDAAGPAGTAGLFARSQHGHQLVTSSASPAALGTAAAGTSGTAPSRGDHVHPNTATGVKWTSGTSMPGSPSTNDRITRTDLGLDFFYDGTQWLSTQLFRISGNGLQTGATPTTVTRASSYFRGYSIYIEDLVTTMSVATTNDGTHYWTFTLEKWTPASVATVLANPNTSGNAADTFVNTQTAINAVVVPASHPFLTIHADKTSTPGTLTAGWFIEYRLIGT